MPEVICKLRASVDTLSLRICTLGRFFVERWMYKMRSKFERLVASRERLA